MTEIAINSAAVCKAIICANRIASQVDLEATPTLYGDLCSVAALAASEHPLPEGWIDEAGVILTEFPGVGSKSLAAWADKVAAHLDTLFT